MDRLVAKVVKNTISGFGLRLLTMLMAFVTIPVFIDKIGAEGYGLIQLVGTLSGYMLLLGAGVPAGTTKFVAEYSAKGDEDEVRRIVDTSLAFFFGVGVVAGLVLAAFAAFGGVGLFEVGPELVGEAETIIYVAAGMALITWPSNALSATLEGLQEHHHRNVITGATTLAGQGAALAMALSDQGIVAVFVAQQAGVTLRALWLAATMGRFVKGWSPLARSASKQTFGMIFGFSVWMLLSHLAQLFTYRIDHIVIGAFLDVRMIAVYDVVLRPFQFIRQMSSYFNAAIMPAVSAAQESDGRAGVEAFAMTGSRYSNAFVAPMAIVGGFLAAPFIALWVGEEYTEYAWLAQLACVFQLLFQSNALISRVFYGTGRVVRLTILAFGVGLTNAILSFWWVHIWELPGVVFATFAGIALIIPLQYLWVFPTLEIPRLGYLAGGVLRGIAPHLVLGALLLPLYEVLTTLDSWLALFGVAAALAALFYTAAWFTVVSREHREWVAGKLRGRLSRSRA